MELQITESGSSDQKTVAVPMKRCSKKKVAMQMKSDQFLRFDRLSFDVLFEIIIRLPFSSLGRLKCSCKFWYYFLMDSKVIDLHLRYSMWNPGFLCSIREKVYHVGGQAHAKTVYYVGREDEKVGPSSDNIEEIKPFAKVGPSSDNIEEIKPFDVFHTRRRFPYSYSGSAGGLLAYCSLTSEKDFYICNPITKEHVKAPPLKFPHELAWGFGYSSSTKEYKIVRFGYGGVDTCITEMRLCDQFEMPFLEMQLSFEGVKPNPIFLGAIYSLGSNSWREICQVPFPPWGLHVDLNGTLFWLIWNSFYEGEERLMSFNIDTQKFKALPGPPLEAAAVVATPPPMLMNIRDTLAFVVDGDSVDGFKFWVLADEENGVWEYKGNVIMENGWKAPWGILWKAHLNTRWLNRQLFIINRCALLTLSYAKVLNYPIFKSVSEEDRFRDMTCYHLIALPHAGSLVSPLKLANYIGD